MYKYKEESLMVCRLRGLSHVTGSIKILPHFCTVFLVFIKINGKTFGGINNNTYLCGKNRKSNAGNI